MQLQVWVQGYRVTSCCLACMLHSQPNCDLFTARHSLVAWVGQVYRLECILFFLCFTGFACICNCSLKPLVALARWTKDLNSPLAVMTVSKLTMISNA